MIFTVSVAITRGQDDKLSITTFKIKSNRRQHLNKTLKLYC